MKQRQKNGQKKQKEVQITFFNAFLTFFFAKKTNGTSKVGLEFPSNFGANKNQEEKKKLRTVGFS